MRNNLFKFIKKNKVYTIAYLSITFLLILFIFLQNNKSSQFTKYDIILKLDPYTIKTLIKNHKNLSIYTPALGITSLNLPKELNSIIEFNKTVDFFLKSFLTDIDAVDASYSTSNKSFVINDKNEIVREQYIWRLQFLHNKNQFNLNEFENFIILAENYFRKLYSVKVENWKTFFDVLKPSIEETKYNIFDSLESNLDKNINLLKDLHFELKIIKSEVTKTNQNYNILIFLLVLSILLYLLIFILLNFFKK